MQASFHFKCFREQNGAKVLLDDSRQLMKAPFELLLGKQFVLPAWEDAIRTMTVGEHARFQFPAKLVTKYPSLATVLRKQKMDAEHQAAGHQSHNHHGHSCAGLEMGKKEYRDLYELDGVDLEVEIELVSYVLPMCDISIDIGWRVRAPTSVRIGNCLCPKRQKRFRN